MAAPGRVYLGLLVFSLIAALTVVPTTFIILTGYEPPAHLPLYDPGEYGTGDKLAFTVASIFCLLLVVAAWRLLVRGARQRQDLRRQRHDRNDAVEVGGTGVPVAAVKGSPTPPGTRRGSGEDEEPPGYG